MTPLMINAILSLLIAFGVDTPKVNNVRDILIPPVVTATTTTFAQITPIQVIQTPVIENQPIYFGSIQPVNNSPATSSPVVVLPPMTPTISISFDKDSVDLVNHQADTIVNATIEVKDANGKEYPFNVTAGSLPRRTGFNTFGPTVIDITGDNIMYWELRNSNDNKAPFPVIVDTPTDSLTKYITIQ